MEFNIKINIHSIDCHGKLADTELFRNILGWKSFETYAHQVCELLSPRQYYVSKTVGYYKSRYYFSAYAHCKSIACNRKKTWVFSKSGSNVIWFVKIMILNESIVSKYLR